MKAPYLSDSFRHRPLYNSPNLLLIHLYTICTNNKANNFFKEKNTFLIISVQPFFPQNI